MSFLKEDPNFIKKTLIKKSASLGANCTIVCGNIIGEYAFVGAGSVITKNIPDFSLVVGNPGKIIGWVNKQGEKLEFKSTGISNCGSYIYFWKIILLSI